MKSNYRHENNSVDQRILKTASTLFYQQGYDQTGINQVLKASKSHKASLYHHFGSKEDLAFAFIDLEEHRLLAFLNRALGRSKDWQTFTDLWVSIISRGIRKELGMGCPFLRLGQTQPPSGIFSKRLQKVFQKAQEIFATYFSHTYQYPEAKAVELSKQVLAIYEGATQMIVMSGDLSYVQIMNKLLKQVVDG